jgi:hypothetical protein
MECVLVCVCLFRPVATFFRPRSTRPLSCQHILGLGLATSGVLLACQMWRSSQTDTSRLSWALFLALARIIVAVLYRIVVDSSDRGSVGASQLVGTRGLYGFVLACFLCYLFADVIVPGHDAAGHLENFRDSIDMIKNSMLLFLFLLVAVLVVLPTQFFAETLHARSGGNDLTRLLWGTLQPVLVWGGSLLLWRLTLGWYVVCEWGPVGGWMEC